MPSGEITNKPLLQHAAATGLPMLMSSGMATLQEVQQAVAEGRTGELLGMPTGTKPEGATAAVVQRTRDGTEVTAVAVAPGTEAATTEMLANAASPGDTISLESPEQVLSSRNSVTNRNPIGDPFQAPSTVSFSGNDTQAGQVTDPVKVDLWGGFTGNTPQAQTQPAATTIQSSQGAPFNAVPATISPAQELEFAFRQAQARQSAPLAPGVEESFPEPATTADLAEVFRRMAGVPAPVVVPPPTPVVAPPVINDRIFSTDYTGPRYTYGMRNRPVGFGTAPKGYIIGSGGPAVGRARNGTIQYPRELTAQELYDFEMELMPDASTTQAMAAAEAAQETEFPRGSRFQDATGNIWEVWSNRQGTIIAHPVVDGKAVVNNGSGQRWAITDAAKMRNPEDRTDISPVAVQASPAAPAAALAPLESRPVDREFEKVLAWKGVIPLINGMYQVPAKLWNQRRVAASKLNVPREQESKRYRMRSKGDVTGDWNARDSGDTIIFDESVRGARALYGETTAPANVMAAASKVKEASAPAPAPAVLAKEEANAWEARRAAKVAADEE
jgi:hypothetical protein